MSAKNGFCVVAPTSTMPPSSTSGSSTSCCALLKRWISSTNSSVRGPPAESRSRAASSTSRVLLRPSPRRPPGTCPSWFPPPELGQRRLTGAGRAVKNHRPEPVGGDQPAEQLAFGQEMLLPGKFRKRPRPHPRSKRLSLLTVPRLSLGKQRHRIIGPLCTHAAIVPARPECVPLPACPAVNDVRKLPYVKKARWGNSRFAARRMRPTPIFLRGSAHELRGNKLPRRLCARPRRNCALGHAKARRHRAVCGKCRRPSRCEST